MKFEVVNATLASIPFTGTRKAKFLYDFVIKHRLNSVLELGFAYGVSALYFASAIQEIGGHIDAVDLVDGECGNRLEELSSELGLEHLIGIHREYSSYTWFLKKQIEKHPDPIYDLCFIDGPKDWTNDGAAFFLVDRLLKPGGWIILDDYSWSYRQHERTSGHRYERGYVFPKMSEEEWSQPQVEAIFRLLVCRHPDYGNFQVVDDTLAIAQKTSHSSGRVRLGTTLTPSYVVFELLKHIKYRANSK